MIRHDFTVNPGSAILLATIAIASLCLLLYILISASKNNGIAVMPDFLLLGWGGAAWFPSIILIAKRHRGNAALIAHERCHQTQQQRDGYIKWAWRYVTDRWWRLEYEAEAYGVWLLVHPDDRWKIMHWLTEDYGFSYTEAHTALERHTFL